MEHLFTKFTNKFTRHLAISIFLVLYLVFFIFLFTQKGIHLYGHFYKKSANLTQITYKAASFGADFKEIKLQKFIDKSLITVDDSFSVTVYADKSFDIVAGSDTTVMPDIDWALISSQKAERMRGFGSKHWAAVGAVYILLFLSRHYNTRLYSFFNKNKAAGENYYRIFDRFFVAACIMALIYFILPF